MQEMKYFNEGNDCDICKNQLMTGRDGTVEDCRRRQNGLSCRFEERDIRTCPVCEHEVDREDMYFTNASVIMFACDELHFATGAQAMIHKPLCMAWGNADDFKEVIKQLDLCEDSILDVYEEHLKEGVTRDKIKSFMAKEKWFSGAELAEYFDVLIDEKAAVAACASDYFEKYNHVPESIKGTATKDIVDAVLAELENRNNAAAEAEKQRIEAEKQDILADLDMYGI